jgi:hypothetical protein
MAATSIISESIIDFFSMELPKNTKLYKGSDEKTLDVSRRSPVWFSQTKSVSKKYGANTFEFVTNRKLKLINITSHLFRMHFLDQVNINSQGKEIDNVEALRLKEALLSPLGLPNTLIQKEIVKKHVPEPRPSFCNFADGSSTEHLAEFIGFHRYSGTSLDMDMVSMMKNIYGKYVDGYIQPMKIPTCWHHVFGDEVCIFDVGGKPTLFPIKIKSGGKKVKGGSGGGDPRESEDAFTAVEENMRRVFGLQDQEEPLVKQI